MDVEKLMRKCFELAQEGAGFVSPNPLVGAVIIKDGEIIGEGAHKAFGFPHAEIEAIQSVNNIEDLEGASIFVNLEPCSHHGKTPPCCESLVNYGFSEVYIALGDPNPKVSGNGIKYLENHGVKVHKGILEEEAKWLNRYFLKNIKTGLPYIIIKMAQTLDGFIAREDGTSKWITNKQSRKDVHLTRSMVDAVLVGRNTAQIDNPSLNVRHVEGRNPKRVVIDKSLSLGVNLNLFSDDLAEKTIVLYDEDSSPEYTKLLLKQSGVSFIDVPLVDSYLDLHEAFNLLSSEQNIASLVVEGGSGLFSQLIQKQLVDELELYIAPKIWGKGKKSFVKELDNFQAELYKTQNFSEDIKLNYKLSYPNK